MQILNYTDFKDRIKENGILVPQVNGFVFRKDYVNYLGIPMGLTVAMAASDILDWMKERTTYCVINNQSNKVVAVTDDFDMALRVYSGMGIVDYNIEHEDHPMRYMIVEVTSA